MRWDSIRGAAWVTPVWHAAPVTRRRVLAVLVVGLAGVGGLAGCRTSPTVAAYVGDAQVTVAELDDAVAERLADPDIAGFVAGDEVGYTRQVLSLRVTEEAYTEVARPLDGEVSDADVQAQIDELLAGSDEADVFAQVARQEGVSAADIRENVRQQLVRQRAAVAAGEADLSEQALRERYAQVQGQLSRSEIGFVTVPDQATADAVLAQLTADPAGYPAVAATYAGPYTLPQVEARAPEEVPGVLAEPFAATGAGQGFTLPVEEVGGVVVGFVASVTTPEFAAVRDQLAQEAEARADEAGTALVAEVRDDLDLTVNPRYGTLEEDRVVAGDGGVVRLLADAGDAPEAAAGD